MRDYIKQLLVEKSIEVKPSVDLVLSNINTKLAKNILKFLKSENIKDNRKVDYVDYNAEDESNFTIGYTNKNGKSIEQKFPINKLLKFLGYDIKSIPDYQKEELINMLKKTNVGEYNYGIVSGAEILKVFHCKNHEEGLGDLNTSCMRSDVQQSYLSIYVENPDVIKCLVLYNNEGEVRGRALIWKTSKGFYLDRVYVSYNQYKRFYKTYAKDNGINLTFDNGNANENMEVQVIAKDYGLYPYMDTFKGYDSKDGVLHPYNGDSDLTSTEGGGSQYVETMTGNRVHRDDAVILKYGGLVGKFIEKEATVKIYDYNSDSNSNNKEEIYALKSDVITSYNGEKRLKKNCVKLYTDYDDSFFGEVWAGKEETVKDYEGNVILRDDGFKMIVDEFENQYVHKSMAVKDYLGRYIPEDEARTIDFGQYNGKYITYDEYYDLEENVALQEFYKNFKRLI